MNRDIQKEIQYFVYNDPEYREDMENISYPALFSILGELLDRVEELEQRLDKNDKWKKGLAKVAQENLSNLREINSRM